MITYSAPKRDVVLLLTNKLGASVEIVEVVSYYFK